MATQRGGKKLPAKTSLPSSDYYIPPLPVAVAPVAETTEELVMGMAGWVVAVLLVAFMLPLLAFMYLDVLEAKHEVKQQLEKVEKLRRQIEQQQRKEKDK